MANIILTKDLELAVEDALKDNRSSEANKIMREFLKNKNIKQELASSLVKELSSMPHMSKAIGKLIGLLTQKVREA